MKVKELIELLGQFNPGAEVSLEGCDCIGVANGVVTEADFYKSGVDAQAYADSNDIIITREP